METECEQLLEMLWFGSVHAALPVLNGLLAYPKEAAQCSLGQAHLLTERHTGSPEGVLTFEVIGMRLFHLPSLLHATTPVCSHHAKGVILFPLD